MVKILSNSPGIIAVTILVAIAFAHVAIAQTPECKKTMAALKKASAMLTYWDELPDPDVPDSQYQHKHIDRTFPRRGVREVTFNSYGGDEDDALYGLKTLRDLEEPEKITLILISFAPARFDDLAKQIETLKKLKAVHLMADLEKPAGDAELAPLAKIENLELLALSSIRRTDVTDAGLAHLSGLRNLKSLILDNSRVTDAGLSRLKDLKSLEYLSLAVTDVTGEGLRHLDGAALKRLNLVESKLADASLEQVARFKNLDFLFLAGCPVDGSGLHHLAGLHKLERLALSRTKIDDAGLANLPALPRLRDLSFVGCPITDASIDVLAKFKGLKELHLDDTKMTEAGKRDLRKALPDTKIENTDLRSLFSSRRLTPPSSALASSAWRRR